MTATARRRLLLVPADMYEIGPQKLMFAIHSLDSGRRADDTRTSYQLGKLRPSR